MSALISAKELKDLLSQPGQHIKVLDASYNLAPSAMGIPDALDFNIDDVADPISPFAHTIPTAEIFSAKTSALGIRNEDLVVVYDRSGIAMAAARVWWMFRLFGHENVKILDGGLPAWTKAGHEVAEKAAFPTPSHFRVNFRPELLKTWEEISENIQAKKFSLLDARDTKRYETGHIPSSLSVPYAQLVNPDGTLRQKKELEKYFEAAGADLKQNLACTCGSGVTACVVALALHELGRKDAAVYDGSWTEWGANPALPRTQGIKP